MFLLKTWGRIHIRVAWKEEKPLTYMYATTDSLFMEKDKPETLNNALRRYIKYTYRFDDIKYK